MMTKRQIQVLKILRDNNLATVNRLYSFLDDYDLIVGEENQRLKLETVVPLISGGYLKNIGSKRYRKYTISKTGLTYLERIGR